MFIQISLFKDADYTKSVYFYINRRQVDAEWGVSGREGDRGREKRIRGVRDGASERI
jgi:hypothetical protein